MRQIIVDYLHDTFVWLIEKYDFIIENEVNEEQAYKVLYRSNVFTLKLEKYRREFYPTLHKTNNLDKGANLFNLLSYLNQSSATVPSSNYFTEEKDLDECYRKQISHISKTIFDNFTSINDFFKDDNLESNLANLTKFMLKKYPELFKGIDTEGN